MTAPAEPAPQRVHWKPFPGQQTFALMVRDVRELLFGGARGGTKTTTGIMWMIQPPYIQHQQFRGLVLRRNSEDLKDWVDRAEYLWKPLGPVRIGKPAEFHFPSGAVIWTGHLKDADAYTKYQGWELQKMLLEELQQIQRERDYLNLLTSCRSTLAGLDAQVFATANPGGKGHAWIKNRWKIGVRKPNLAFRNPDDHEWMMYCPATVDDNPAIMQIDPGYVRRLEALPEPLRAAWRYGNWDIFTGQAFDFADSWPWVVDGVPVPATAPLFMTFDAGFGKPFSVGWWWVDLDGRVWRFGEWYGCTGEADVGVRMPDSEIAKGIHEREAQLGIAGRDIKRLGGRDCFAKQPDKRGGGQGPSTAETWAKLGLYLSPADDSSRVNKIRQFRERLIVPKKDDGTPAGLPMLVVYKNCEHFRRTVPLLVMDETNPEDVDTDSEDHIYDEACHICMARPVGTVIGLLPQAGNKLAKAGKKEFFGRKAS